MPTLENQIEALIDEAYRQGIDIIDWLKTQQIHQKIDDVKTTNRTITLERKESNASI